MSFLHLLNPKCYVFRALDLPPRRQCQGTTHSILDKDELSLRLLSASLPPLGN